MLNTSDETDAFYLDLAYSLGMLIQYDDEIYMGDPSYETCEVVKWLDRKISLGCEIQAEELYKAAARELNLTPYLFQKHLSKIDLGCERYRFEQTDIGDIVCEKVVRFVPEGYYFEDIHTGYFDLNKNFPRKVLKRLSVEKLEHKSKTIFKKKGD